MLSITVCTLNEEQYLPKLLESIKSQQGVVYEVIIVDACSEDKTAQVAAQYKAGGMPLTFITLENIRNISTQRNTGANNSKYEYLVFLDADVVLPPNCLADAMQEMTSQGIKVAGTKIYATESAFSYRMMYWNYSNLYLPLLRLFKPAMHGCSIFSTKEIHEKIGGFNQGIIFEDYKYGVDAAPYYRSKLLKSTYVRTSARRFYNATWKSSLELFLAGVYSLYKAGIDKKYMKEYNKTTGKHSTPQY